MRTFFAAIVVLLGSVYVSSTSCNYYNPHAQGERLYLTHCAACHMDDGKGLRDLIPSLHESAFLTRENIHFTGCLIRYGIKRPDPLDPSQEIFPMPPLPDLSETEISNILNYIGNHFDNEAGYTNPVKLRETLSDCPNRAPRQY